ncbi:MAG: ABC transporter permease [Firmicutes bacterium]|nr:ABC transporter permease [Bacillota bacterium]
MGFFIGLRVTHDSMRKTADDYLTDLLFYDFRLVSTLGLTDSDVVAFQNEPNVLLAEGSVSVNVLAEMDKSGENVLAFHTMLPAMDRLDIVSGRLPESDGEVVLDALYAKPGQVGKTLTVSSSNDEDTLDLFTTKTFKIVGTVNSPYYANFERGSTSLGSGKIAGFAYVLSGAFDSDYYTEILLRLTDMPAMGTDAYHDAADAAQDRLEELLEERGDIRYMSLKDEANEKIADAQAEIDDGWEQIADGRQKIADAEKQLADAKKELADARKELDDGWAELRDAESELADAKVELDDAKKELEDAEAELADGRKELDDAKQELADARKELDDGWAEYYDGVQKYEDGKKEYEDGLAEYEKGMKAYRSGRADANAQLSAASQQLSDAEAQLAGTRQQLDQAIAYKEQIEQSLPYLSGEDYDNAAAQVQTMTAQIAYGESVYADGMAQLDAGKAAYADAEASANRQLRSARKKLENAKKQLDDAKIELDDAEVELQDALVKLEDGEKEYADGLAEYEDGEADYAEGFQKYEDGKREYEDGLKEYEDGLKEYEDGKKELEDGEKEYADGLREYYSKSADAEKKISDAKADIAQAEEDLTEGQQKVDDAKVDLEELKEPNVFVLGRDMNNGYAALENDTAIVKGIAKVFPLFFFLVAVLVCITTMTRMVDEQRTEDGTLKALGYGDGAIASRYLIYASSASLIGCFVGFFVGSKFMPMAIWKVYRIMYAIDRPAAFVLDWKMFGICTVLYILCSLGATWFVIHKELKEPAAQLIRPEAPKAGKRVLLERIPLIWKRLNFLRKVSIRNIFLYKKRMIMMIVGIGGCTALLLTGFGIRDTISKIVDYQYEEISVYDGAVTFADPLDAQGEDDFRKEYKNVITDAAFLSITQMDVNHDGSEEANIVVFREPLQNFVDIHTGGEALAWPGKGETVVDYRLARDLKISVGDTITVVDDELRKMDLKVTGIFDNYLYDYVFVTEETFAVAFGFVPDYKNAYVNFPEEADLHRSAAELLSSDDILDVTLAADLRSTIGSLLSSMDYIVIIVLICSGALAFIVLYNLTNISITERKREIATLKVLGFYQNETDQYVFRENLILTGIAAVFGIPAGIALLRYVMAQVTIKQMYFGCRLAPLSYVYSIVITFVFAILINLVLRRKIDNIDMAESMKAIE